MKTLNPPISKHLPALRLYLDDVQAIFACLEQNCGGRVSITTCNHEIGSPEELQHLAAEYTNDLSIECTEPYLTLELKAHDGRLYVGGSDVQCAGICAKVESLLAHCPKCYPVLHPWLAQAIIFGVVVLAPAWLWGRVVQVSELWSWAFTLVALWIAFSIEFEWRFKHYNTVVFARRKDRPGWLRRNRDQLALAVVSAIAGSIVTLTAQALWQRLLPGSRDGNAMQDRGEIPPSPVVPAEDRDLP
ncbi:MAG: hypothetical protein KJZ69_18420 [Phycisphaerales bacterium]|nr:hypothetical protein [Phycisphaerales bacterium]